VTIDDDDVMPSSLCLSLSRLAPTEERSLGFFLSRERERTERKQKRAVYISLSLFSLFIKREMRTFHENKKRDIIDVVYRYDQISLFISLFRFLLLLFGAAPAAVLPLTTTTK